MIEEKFKATTYQLGNSIIITIPAYLKKKGIKLKNTYEFIMRIPTEDQTQQ